MIHSGDEHNCTKYYGMLDVNNLENNFVSKKFIDMLISSYVEIFNDRKFGRMITYLKYFNLKGVNITDRCQVNEFKFALTNALDSRVSI